MRYLWRMTRHEQPRRSQAPCGALTALLLLLVATAPVVRAWPVLFSGDGATQLTSGYGADVLLSPDAGGRVIVQSAMNATAGVQLGGTLLDEDFVLSLVARLDAHSAALASLQAQLTQLRAEVSANSTLIAANVTQLRAADAAATTSLQAANASLWAGVQKLNVIIGPYDSLENLTSQGNLALDVADVQAMQADLMSALGTAAGSADLQTALATMENIAENIVELKDEDTLQNAALASATGALQQQLAATGGTIVTNVTALRTTLEGELSSRAAGLDAAIAGNASALNASVNAGSAALATATGALQQQLGASIVSNASALKTTLEGELSSRAAGLEAAIAGNASALSNRAAGLDAAIASNVSALAANMSSLGASQAQLATNMSSLGASQAQLASTVSNVAADVSSIRSTVGANVSALQQQLDAVNRTLSGGNPTSALDASVNGAPSPVCNARGYIWSPAALVAYCACYAGWSGMYCETATSSTTVNLALQRPVSQSSTAQMLNNFQSGSLTAGICMQTGWQNGQYCGQSAYYSTCSCSWTVYYATIANDGVYNCVGTMNLMVGPLFYQCSGNSCSPAQAAYAAGSLPAADSQSATNSEANPWWSVDLGSYFAVGTVRIQAVSTLGMSLSLVSYDANGGEYTTACYASTLLDVTSATPGVFTCAGRAGRFLRLAMPGQTAQLKLCEVEVYALPNPYSSG